MPRDGKGVDLAVVFGPAKGGKKPPKAGPGMMMGDEDEGLPPDFESAAGEAFPNMTPDRMAAFKRAIEACVAAKDEGEYDAE